MRVGYDTGLHPWRNQYLPGPFNWITDASLLRFFRFRERLRLRDTLSQTATTLAGNGGSGSVDVTTQTGCS